MVLVNPKLSLWHTVLNSFRVNFAMDTYSRGISIVCNLLLMHAPNPVRSIRGFLPIKPFSSSMFTGLSCWSSHLSSRSGYTHTHQHSPGCHCPFTSNQQCEPLLTSSLAMSTIFFLLKYAPLAMPNDRYCVPEFPHSSATFNILSGSCILASPKVLQGAFGDSACPTQHSQPCPMLANRHPTGLTWFPIVLYYIK